MIAPGIALGHVVGRLGCFLAGCCYGTETTVPWGVVFTNPLALENVGTPLDVPLHPTQLYEAGAEALILVGLLIFEKRGRAVPRPHVLGLHARLRPLAVRHRVLPRRSARHVLRRRLSTSQFISLLIVPLSLVMLYWLSRQPAPVRDLAPARKLA